jgi:hypothetical protein
VAKPEIKPIWNTSSFLVYTGGLTVLGAAIAALAYLSSQYPGHGQGTAWALLFYVILFALAYALRRLDRPIASGILAFSSVIAFGYVVIRAFEWFGWNGVNASSDRWSWAAIGAMLLILLAAGDTRRRFRFPFIRLISATLFFSLVVQVLPSGGNWTAAWALVVGLAYLLVGKISAKPSSFWLHLVGGALIGFAFLTWFHTSDGDFAVISIAALVFVLVGYWTSRSSWAFFGTLGFYIATIHYLIGSATHLIASLIGIAIRCSASGGAFGPPPGCTSVQLPFSPWAPALAFALLGFWLIFLGVLVKRMRGHKHTAVVVTPPAPAVEAPAAE